MSDKEYFYTLYKKAVEEFQQELPSLIDGQLATFPHNDQMRLETIRFVRDGGKKLRSVLAKLVTQFYGVSDGGASAALDTLHKFLLCHDDIMDKDRLRWGRLTVHAALEHLIDNETEREHFGNGLAIVSGDLMAAMAFRLVLDAALDSEQKVGLARLMCRCIDEVSWGWYDQLRMDYEPLDSPLLSYERIKNSLIWVTGKYTMSFPLRFAYTIIGLPMPSLLEEIADDLGILFQTGDDLIGIFGDSSTSGKSNFGDIAQGKKTLPMWFAYQMGDSRQKERLSALVGKHDINEVEVEEVRQIMQVNGSYGHSKMVMNEYATSVKEKLQRIDLPSQMKQFLAGFADYLIERES